VSPAYFAKRLEEQKEVYKQVLIHGNFDLDTAERNLNLVIEISLPAIRSLLLRYPWKKTFIPA
jgi:hypothetical protein